MVTVKKSVLFVTSCLILLVCSGSCGAQTERPDSPGSLGREANEQFLELDKTILAEFIKLARFNLLFHETANKHWWWRSVLYPLEQEAGTACSFANSLIDLRERIKGFRDTSLKSVTSLRRGEVSSLVGGCLGGGSSALELAQNLMVDAISRKRGYSPRSRIQYVKESLATIDALLAKREQLVTNEVHIDQDRRVRNIEGLLMRHLRNRLLLEFRKWSILSQGTMCNENTSFAIDALQNFAQVGSSVISLRAFEKPELDGASSIVSLSASVVSAFNPTISWLAGKTARAQHRRHLNREFPGSDKLEDESPVAWQAEIDSLTADGIDATQIREISFVGENSEKFDRALDKEMASIVKLRRVAAQQAVSAPLIGSTSVAKNICSIIGFFGYQEEPLVRNKIGLAGRITSLCGQSYSLVKTPTTQIHDFIHQRSLRKRGEHPSQILQKRLDNLDRLEARIKAGKLYSPRRQAN